MSETCIGCSSYLSGPIGQTFTSSIQTLAATLCLINPNWPPDSSFNTTDLNFDYIVVGAGSAGCVVAARLSEDENVRVLLVEAGGDPPLESVIPSGILYLPESQYDWNYKTEPQPRACRSTGGVCLLASGKMLGGSGSINSHFYVRGNRQDYDDIAKAGNEGWDYETALKYFKKSENMTSDTIKFNPDLAIYHNFSGPIPISIYNDLTRIDKIVLQGYTEAGYYYGLDYNSANQIGAYLTQATIFGGRRQSTAVTYLIPARNRPNLIIFKNSLATKIIISDKVATGVEILLNNGSIIEATARKEVIVSAGCIRTPQLLMLSGIGPKEELDKFNISVVADLSVGKNFFDHTAVVLPVQAIAPIHFQLPSDIPVDVAKILMLGTGFYNREHYPAYNVIAFIKTTTDWKSRNLPNFRVTLRPEPLDPTPIAIVDGVEIYNASLNFYLEFLNEVSRGRVTLRSTDATDPPKIFPNYFDDERDIEMHLRIFKFIENLTKTPTYQSIKAKMLPEKVEGCECLEPFSEDYYRCMLLYHSMTSRHYLGTAKMGPSCDPNAVVNDKLQVYGIKNLRVVDGSVIPNGIRGNTNAPIIMVAERASDLIKAGN